LKQKNRGGEHAPNGEACYQEAQEQRRKRAGGKIDDYALKSLIQTQKKKEKGKRLAQARGKKEEPISLTNS